MVELYYIDTKNYSLSELNIQTLPKYRLEKINRLVHENDKLACACAGLMVRKILGEGEIKLNEYGKPYINGEKSFSISHSGNYVILAVSGKEVGCDIEFGKDLNYERVGKVVFHENELKKLSAVEDKKDYFFKLWTAKEAFIKCLGEGFHFKVTELDLSELPDKISYKNKDYFFKKYMLGSAWIMLCGGDKFFPEIIKEAKI